MPAQWRERPDRPIHEDPRLESISRLAIYHRNQWVEYDFDGETDLAEQHKMLYDHYSQLLKEGKAYEPKF